MYEDLIKRLNAYSAEHQNHGGITAEAADAIESMCEMVAMAYEENANIIQSYEDSKPRWFPVTEEPPLKVGEDGYNGYLVYANGDYKVADYMIDKFDNTSYFASIRMDGEYEPYVTHYMPLPKPPTEGSQMVTDIEAEV